MRSIPYWIQRADFSASDHESVDEARALELISSHDWSGEWRLASERQAAGLETCPAGIGFSEGERILHVCPEPDGTALMHYHFAEVRQWLGFIRRRTKVVRTNPAVMSIQVQEFVRHFFRNDHSWLVDNTSVG